MFLSQPPKQITPSISWPFTAVSIASAITSRETSEYFIPSVPMPIPLVTVGKPNACGIAPAAFTAARTRSTRGWMPALQGFIVEWPFATPTIALSKSPSPKPTARSIARLGERASPWVMVLLLQLSDIASGSLCGKPGFRLRFEAILLETTPRTLLHARPSELRSRRDFTRPDRDPLVRDHVSGRLCRGVLAGPACFRRGAARQFHQRRALRPGHRPALGDAVPRRGAAPAPSLAALPVRPRGGAPVRDPLDLFGEAAAGGRGVGRVPARLRGVSFRGRILSRAR